MEVDPPLPSDDHILADPEKITILPGATHSAATFSLKDEDHTLGNSLRYIIMKNVDVEFCGYSLPHPSEPKFHLRIQMYNNKSAIQALMKGLSDLEDLTMAIMTRYEEEVAKGTHATYEEPTVEERLQEIKRKKYPHLLNGSVMEE
ncbi:hypothetical protein CROQUDRAFT_544327 [Cronartium quercuum f. sp. fusiforme G11]|uniref:DNA-directed RNA polymerases I and III subunit RPAC2 n=1 Tax=Cronartium quercuum f. sp. fusiforme G11 TaxID=708437 RepID=A0A9P6NW81_9BASI|nr:hypothetical protein CROQUDRAFT_544327 [Cronartium quercuum f. sp. fusiforme G11]